MSPLEQVRADVLSCGWDTSRFLFFSGEVDTFVYYSHLFPAIASLILALVILRKGTTSVLTTLFVLIALLFSAFALIDLFLWAEIDPSKIMFAWSLLTYIEPLIYALTLYLVIAYAFKRDPSLKEKIAAGLLLLPVILLGPTNLNLSAYDYSNCDRLAVEGSLLLYVYFIEIIFVIWMITAALRAYRKTKEYAEQKSIVYITVGSILFLVAFSLGNILGTFLQEDLGEVAWAIGQYGLFGMPIFLAFILYIIVKFDVFNTRLLSAEALTLSLWVLLLAILFANDVETVKVIVSATLVLFAILGFILIKGIRRDIQQKKQIEELAANLKKANARLKILDRMKSEFVSVASHQLRSPLAAIRGYASMLLEGSYGTLSKKSTEAVERIADSSRFMALSVEDYLNVSRIEAGNMKYEIADFNLKDVAEKIVDEMRPAALKKGLLMVFRSDVDGSGMIHADIGKTRQVILNIIDNSMKYTPSGSITVCAHDDVKKKKMYVSVKDTGVGMSRETVEEAFDKFIRAKNANEVNVTGTGLGLFVAKKIIEEMGGKIWAESEGEGKGSTFHIEFPFVKPGAQKNKK